VRGSALAFGVGRWVEDSNLEESTADSPAPDLRPSPASIMPPGACLSALGDGSGSAPPPPLPPPPVPLNRAANDLYGGRQPHAIGQTQIETRQSRVPAPFVPTRAQDNRSQHIPQQQAASSSTTTSASSKDPAAVAVAASMAPVGGDSAAVGRANPQSAIGAVAAQSAQQQQIAEALRAMAEGTDAPVQPAITTATAASVPAPSAPAAAPVPAPPAPVAPPAEMIMEPEMEHQLIQPTNWTRGRLIGAGAFGQVYMGLNNDTGEIFAVKQVALTKDEHLRGRVGQHIRALEAEVDVLRQLRNVHIVQYMGTERSEDSLK
jgi:hypothetical protein